MNKSVRFGMMLVFVFAAAAVAFAAPAQQNKTVLNIGVNSTVSSLDPALSGNGDPIDIFPELAYDPLMFRMPDGSFGPGLAVSWRYVGAENKVFEITLRPGVKFSDGETLTAEGVKKHFEYYGQAGGPFAGRIKEFASVEVTGPLSLRITLTRSNPELPFELCQRQVTGSIISPKGIADPKSLGTMTAGAGPYMIDPKETVTDQKYTYVPNPYYWNPKAILWKKIVVKVIPDPNATLSALLSGQLDYAFGSPRTAAAAAKAGYQVQTAPYILAQVQIMDRNGTITPALGDVRVRQALNYAIDRKAVAAALFGDYGTPDWQCSLPGEDLWSDSLSTYYPYDPEKAKNLLADAGYAQGLEIPMIAFNLQPGETDAAAAIASEWAKVGVGTQITVPVSFADYVGRYAKFPTMMFFYGIASAQLKGSEWFDGGYANPFGVNDKTIDDLYAQGLAEPDTAKRNAIWVQWHKRLLDLAWMVPFAAQSKIVYVRPGLMGVDLGPTNLDPHPMRFYAQ
ncbi:MAG: ABC transporter substrate-binding protein [Spirochaetia bacterium]